MPEREFLAALALSRLVWGAASTEADAATLSNGFRRDTLSRTALLKTAPSVCITKCKFNGKVVMLREVLT
jgi:hypothetical protein